MKKPKMHMPLIAAVMACLALPAAALEPDAQTTAIVAAADVFLATLTDTQKDAALYDFTDAAKRTNWSNLPIDMVARDGVPWGEMNDAQHAALMKLLGAVLSSDGVLMVQNQMAADDVLRLDQENGGGGPDLTFGSAYY